MSEEYEPVLTQTKQKTYRPSQASGFRSVNNTRHACGRSRDFECRPTHGRGQGSRATRGRGRCNVPALPVAAVAAQNINCFRGSLS